MFRNKNCVEWLLPSEILSTELSNVWKVRVAKCIMRSTWVMRILRLKTSGRELRKRSGTQQVKNLSSPIGDAQAILAEIPGLSLTSFNERCGR